MITPAISNNTKTSIFYINDYHGKTFNMERTVTASKDFDTKNKNNKDVDTLKLSSGDIQIGTDPKTNQIAVMFQNVLGIIATAMGNHEYDIQEKAPEVLTNIKYHLLAGNVQNKQGSPWENKFNKSIIEERNGNKYGIIGMSPVDLFKRSKKDSLDKFISIHDAKNTVADIQNEVNNLQKQGVNKIILLSHLGYLMDTIVAQNTQGIDVILGGHTHDLINGVEENKNLFYSQNAEPVVITQAGKNGDNFGVLNLEFDKKGTIKKVQNNIGYSKDFIRYLPMRYVFDKMFGDNKIYGQINSAPPEPGNFLVETNPHAYFIADCIRKDLDVDIALVPSANVRGSFETGNIDTRTLANILPFKNKLWKINYSEKDIIDAIKKGAESFRKNGNKPGIFYTSGLKYTINTNGQLICASYIDKTNKETPIDINNPRKDKFYTTVITDYCAGGNDGFAMLNRPEQVQYKYPFDATICVENILEKETTPVNIKDDGRINIIKV